MLDILRERYTVAEAHATVDARNEPSLRLLARTGFELADDSDSRNLRFSRMLVAPTPIA